jgi:hypothetical protein
MIHSQTEHLLLCIIDKYVSRPMSFAKEAFVGIGYLIFSQSLQASFVAHSPRISMPSDASGFFIEV